MEEAKPVQSCLLLLLGLCLFSSELTFGRVWRVGLEEDGETKEGLGFVRNWNRTTRFIFSENSDAAAMDPDNKVGPKSIGFRSSGSPHILPQIMRQNSTARGRSSPGVAAEPLFVPGYVQYKRRKTRTIPEKNSSDRFFQDKITPNSTSTYNPDKLSFHDCAGRMHWYLEDEAWRRRCLNLAMESHGYEPYPPGYVYVFDPRRYLLPPRSVLRQPIWPTKVYECNRWGLRKKMPFMYPIQEEERWKGKDKRHKCLAMLLLTKARGPPDLDHLDLRYKEELYPVDKRFSDSGILVVLNWVCAFLLVITCGGCLATSTEWLVPRLRLMCFGIKAGNAASRVSRSTSVPALATVELGAATADAATADPGDSESEENGAESRSLFGNHSPTRSVDSLPTYEAACKMPSTKTAVVSDLTAKHEEQTLAVTSGATSGTSGATAAGTADSAESKQEAQPPPYGSVCKSNIS